MKEAKAKLPKERGTRKEPEKKPRERKFNTGEKLNKRGMEKKNQRP